jgi:hypothetical protein
VTDPTNNIHPAAKDPQQPTESAPAKPWSASVGELLAQAAALCVDQNVDLDAWMRGAWSAYMDARPGYREFLEDKQLREQLKQLREAGRIGQA